MDRRASLNLDLIRWIAALSVFACHFIQLGANDIPARAPEPLDRRSVIVFFVLSGYVIDFVASHKHPGFQARSLLVRGLNRLGRALARLL